MERFKAAVLEGPEKMVIREFQVPETGAEEILLKVDMCAICGSDIHSYRGGYRATAQYPIIIGHEIAGTIAKIGKEAQKRHRLKEGDRIATEGGSVCGRCRPCLKGNYRLCEERKVYRFKALNAPYGEANVGPGGFSQYVVVQDGRRFHRVGDGVSFEAACLATVLGNGIRWVQTRGQAKIGDTLIILGAGGQGLCSLVAGKECGANPIILVGRNCDVLGFQLAKEFGADFVLNAEKEDLSKRIQEITEGQLADVVVDTTGNPESMSRAINFVRTMGNLVLIGTMGENVPTPLYTQTLILKEINLYGAIGQSWNVDQAMKVINAKKYPLEKIIRPVYPLSKINEAFSFLWDHREECIKIGIVPD
jgi:threonine dehydrogenase-like Zn-dependent dehydrogenase